jgi:hypothetical protein
VTSPLVLVPRGFLELGKALEAKRLREPDDGRARRVRSAGELLGRLEGGLLEVVDDIPGDVLLGPGELLEALLDVPRKRESLGNRLDAAVRVDRVGGGLIGSAA